MKKHVKIPDYASALLHVCITGAIIYSCAVLTLVQMSWNCLVFSRASRQIFCLTQPFMGSFKRHIVVLTLLCMFAQINGVLTCYGLFLMNRKAIAVSVCEQTSRDYARACFLQKKIVAAPEEPRPEDCRQRPASKSLAELLAEVQGVEPEIRRFWSAPVAGRTFAPRLTRKLRTGVLPGIDHPPDA
jgi:hypothetical protein